MKFEGRWVYCLTCESEAIFCPVCGTLSCTGTSCTSCHDEFTEAMEMIGSGLAPPKDTLPLAGMDSGEWDRFFACTMTDEEDAKIRKRSEGRPEGRPELWGTGGK